MLQDCTAAHRPTPHYCIDRVVRVGSAVALASVCGAIPACRDRVCVTSHVALCGGVLGGVRPEFSSSPEN